MCQDFPTILVVGNDLTFTRLVDKLRRDDYLVLRARDGVHALRIAITHSRRIHILVADERANGPGLSQMLKLYRADTRILLVAENPEPTLSAVRQFLRPPAQRDGVAA
jgi:hypothetical protein